MSYIVEINKELRDKIALTVYSLVTKFIKNINITFVK